MTLVVRYFGRILVLVIRGYVAFNNEPLYEQEESHIKKLNSAAQPFSVSKSASRHLYSLDECVRIVIERFCAPQESVASLFLNPDLFFGGAYFSWCLLP